jgi:hypothetical protein
MAAKINYITYERPAPAPQRQTYAPRPAPAPQPVSYGPMPHRPIDAKLQGHMIDTMPKEVEEYLYPTPAPAPMPAPQPAYTCRQQVPMCQPCAPYTVPTSYGMPGSSNCAKCGGGLPVDGTYVTAEGQCFHHDCFSCTTCNRAIDGLRYKLVNGNVTCIGCASPPCDCCHRPVEGQRLEAEGRVYHPECFRCNGCDCPLRGEYAINPQNGDRLCLCCDSRSATPALRPMPAPTPMQRPQQGGYWRRVPAGTARQAPAPATHPAQGGGYWRQVPAGTATPAGPPRRMGTRGPAGYGGYGAPAMQGYGY